MLLLPSRPQEIVPIVVAGPLSAAQRSWQLRPPQSTLVVIVRGTFRIAPGASVAPVADPLPPVGDLFQDGDPAASLRHASDFAPFKPEADVTLVGHACRSRDRAEATVVQLALGSLRRALAVVGDRAWQGAVPSEPGPWSRLPLRWERAFGGAGHEPNPIGRGIDGGALPNLEQPDALITSPRSRPAPACLAPVPSRWRSRSCKLGTYDEAWLRDRWPYFPGDFDWSYFNAAPPEQQIPYLRGDETFDLAGVHLEHSVLSGRLPGLSARLFAQYSAAAGGGFREIEAHLDTAAFDADDLSVSLVWRGLLDVSAEAAPELERIFVCADGLAAPLSVEAARERFHAQLVALHGPQVLGEAAAERAGELPAAAPPPAPPTPLAAPVLTRDEALALIESGVSLVGQSFAGCDLSRLDLRGRQLGGALFTDAQLDGARLDGAALGDAVLVRARARGASFQGADLTAANLSEALLAEADFRDASLAVASLVDVDAAGARFDGAKLALAKLTDAQLVGASFERAVAPGADLSGARLDGASFRQATLDDAQLYDCAIEGGHFDEASLQRLRADGATLTASRFVKAKAAEASFESAALERADWSEADLSRAVFSHAVLVRANLSRATAVGARFRHASLVGAQAIKANLMEANFEGADLSGADLSRANLYAVETWRATLQGTRLDQALLAGSKLAT